VSRSSLVIIVHLFLFLLLLVVVIFFLVFVVVVETNSLSDSVNIDGVVSLLATALPFNKAPGTL
jgi:hypothetical protein